MASEGVQERGAIRQEGGKGGGKPRAVSSHLRASRLGIGPLTFDVESMNIIRSRRRLGRFSASWPLASSVGESVAFSGVARRV